jgi:hypothetical protein
MVTHPGVQPGRLLKNAAFDTVLLSRLGSRTGVGVDDFRVPYPVWSQWDNETDAKSGSNRGGHRGEKIALTESGYLLVV